jgi:hypothetical protein
LFQQLLQYLVLLTGGKVVDLIADCFKGLYGLASHGKKCLEVL